MKGYSGLYDGFVTKLAADGSLVFSTFLGGSGWEGAGAIALDSGGNVYVTDFTNSTDFPTTTNAIQRSDGGNYDAFVSELSADGSTLIYSTYLGGGGTDSGYGITVGSSGRVYVAGPTGSSNFPTTPGAFQGVNNAAATGGSNAFVAVLNMPAGPTSTLTLTPTPTPTAAPTATPVPARLKFHPKRRHFGPEVELGGVGNPRPPRYVTLKNPKNKKQNVTVTITGITVNAPDGDFTKDAQHTTCGPSLAPGAKCKVAIVFSPTEPGPRTGTLIVTSNAALSQTISVPLKGKGRQGKLNFNPKSVNFGKESVNSTTDPKTVTLFNKNPMAMDLTVGISGPFTIVNNCPSSLPGGGTCQVEVAFAPTTTDKVQGALTFTDTAKKSPQSVKLIGTGG
jgi:Cep192 domain 4/Beta-propeller repeat